MMTPYEHLKAKLDHAKSIDANVVRVDIEELASVIAELEELRKTQITVNQTGNNCAYIKHVDKLVIK